MRTLAETHARARRHERRRGWPLGYPDNPMVDDAATFRPAALAALRQFRAVHPFRLEAEAFVDAVGTLYGGLSAAYDMPVLTVRHRGPWEGDSIESRYDDLRHRVTLRGRASVLTALHEFGHARGYGEGGAVYWSVNVFRRVFPRSFARLQQQPGSYMLMRADASAERR